MLAGRTSAFVETGHSAAIVTSACCTHKANSRRCPHGWRWTDDRFDFGRTHQTDPLLPCMLPEAAGRGGLGATHLAPTKLTFVATGTRPQAVVREPSQFLHRQTRERQV